MDYSTIKVDEADMIGRLFFDNPPLNVLNIKMMEEINQALKDFQKKKLKVLLVMAHGKVFSAGVDVTDHTKDKVNQMITVFHEIFTNLLKINAPTIAVVNGAALGGGCEIATFCDMVIASEKSKFGQPEIQVGVFPPVAAAIFPKLIWHKKALELMLTGEIIKADEAKHLGLINQVFPVENFEESAKKFIMDKIARNSAVILQLTKRAFIEGTLHNYGESIKKIEDLYLNDLMQTNDANEGLAAFLEKRQPVWKDK
ncbi:MAG: enoyl-CoA hydratase/isomerase family protein [Candidatus Thermoplasmatota archaeon]|nr:enoyl-CoA hydratase/isomerase family protein [Candidatus Thermoplasmatota archaeon]